MVRGSCCFFGHRDACRLDCTRLLEVVRAQILQGDKVFYVGNQGEFDRAVYGCLKQLREEYPYIQIRVVLAYLPTEKDIEIPDSMYPEGLETVHPQYAIEKRNRWMVTASNTCICYIDHTWGGAYKFTKLAKKHGLTVINIGSAEIQVS